jgi:hypothetical protein
MKTLLSIIAAFALLVAFGMPAMANGTDIDDSAVADAGSTAIRGTSAAMANAGSTAVRGSDNSNMFNNDNRKFDSEHNTVAVAELVQVNAITHSSLAEQIIDGDSHIRDNIRFNTDFAGIANANLNTGALNNQAIQNTIAVRYLDIK